jgi:hypothetical protein
MEVNQYDVDTTCRMDRGSLILAVQHLNRARELLIFINNEIIDHTIDALDIIEKLATAWHEINKCRLYTEKDVYFEELLIPAMGLVNDAKMMLESMVHWKLGITPHGEISMLTCIRLAVRDGIEPGINELEARLSMD